MARDNFTKAVIEKLQKRVAHRCSNPDCRVPTIGPASDSDKATSIGIAAHITAASPEGPRYDPALTERERRSMGNGIWLCANCSTAIDKDIDRYPVDRLKSWKTKAEEYAKQELGKRPPGKNDAIDTLTAALTGQSNKLIVDAINNVHKASSSALETLDPRFAINSQFVNGSTYFDIHPKEAVSLTLKVERERAQEYWDKYRNLVDHGIELNIDGDGITIEGSKLFEQLQANALARSIKLSPEKRAATQKLWLLNKDTSLFESFDDIQGEISFGQQSFSFSGSACNEIFTFNYRRQITNDNPNTTMNVGVHFDRWANGDVRALPYFEKIYSFFEKIRNQCRLVTSLEINGIEVMRSKEISLNQSNFGKEIFNILDVLKMASVLASAINARILFDPLFIFTTEEYSAFCNAVSIAKGESVFNKSDLQENILAQFAITDKAQLDQLLQINSPIDFRMMHKDKETLRLFGQTIELPTQIIHVHSAKPVIQLSKAIANLVEGDVVTIEWIPANDFQCRIEFDKSQEV